MRRGLFLVVSCAGLAACVGELGDAPGGSGDPPLPPLVCGAAVQPGPAPIRRMTRFEYDNTVRDLLGDTTRPADSFVAEEEALGFNNQATALGVTPSARARSVVVAGDRSASSRAARCRPSSRTVLPGAGRVPAVHSVPAPRAG